MDWVESIRASGYGIIWAGEELKKKKTLLGSRYFGMVRWNFLHIERRLRGKPQLFNILYVPLLLLYFHAMVGRNSKSNGIMQKLQASDDNLFPGTPTDFVTFRYHSKWFLKTLRRQINLDVRVTFISVQSILNFETPEKREQGMKQIRRMARTKIIPLLLSKTEK